jgi:hypothetical protein
VSEDVVIVRILRPCSALSQNAGAGVDAAIGAGVLGRPD